MNDTITVDFEQFKRFLNEVFTQVERDIPEDEDNETSKQLFEMLKKA